MEWIYKYFSLAAVIAGVGFLVKYLIQKTIDSYFNTKLEDHKKELAVMTEKAKYDINRKLFDFEAYAIKKHTIYPELYQRIFEVRQQWTLLNYNILKNPKNHDDDFIHSIRKIKDVLESKVINTQEYFTNNELFLSKELASNYLDTLSNIWGLHLFIDLEESSYKPSIVNKELSKIDDKIQVLKEIIYKELSYSHFEETEEKVQQSS